MEAGHDSCFVQGAKQSLKPCNSKRRQSTTQRLAMIRVTRKPASGHARTTEKRAAKAKRQKASTAAIATLQQPQPLLELQSPWRERQQLFMANSHEQATGAPQSCFPAVPPRIHMLKVVAAGGAACQAAASAEDPLIPGWIWMAQDAA